jgi:hypothetical protein
MKRILPAVFTATCLLSASLVNTYAKDTKAFKTAQPIICNKTYKTKVKGESQKYFKFTLTRSAKIAITVNGQVNVALSYLNSQGKEASTYNNYNHYLKKGTYCFKINNYLGGDFSYSFNIKKTNYALAKMKVFLKTKISHFQKKGTRITAKINEAKDITDYQVLCSTSKNFTKPMPAYVHFGKIIVDDVPDASSYYLKVRPYRQGITEKYYGHDSNVLTFTS